MATTEVNSLSPSDSDTLLQQWGLPRPAFVDGKPQAMPSWEQNFLQDELDAASIGDIFPHAAFHFPPNMSISDFTAVETLAHQFAANSNWRYMPTGAMILNAINKGFTDSQQTYAYWFGLMKPEYQQQVPWLQFGMSAQSFHQSSDNMGTLLSRLTGSDDLSQLDAATRQKMLSEGWSSAKMEEYMRKSLSASKPWLDQKYGYTYQTWQQNKETHRQDVIQRYGVDAANVDQAYLTFQNNPLQSQERASGAQVTYGSGSNQSTFYNKNSLMDYGSNPVR